MINIVFSIFAYLSLLGQIGIIVVVFGLIFLKKYKYKHFNNIKSFISKRAYSLAFILTLIATFSSLFISEIAKFPPCVLCWYQRIVMYPQPILLFIAILRKEYVLKPYLLVLNILGGFIALYHYLLQILPKSQFIVCNKSLTGIAVSCTENYQFYFGYMSFPLMALTVFLLLIIIMSLSKYAKNITKVDKKLKKLVNEMIICLEKQKNPQGVGLAAPQVGYNLQLFIIKPFENEKPQIIINPKIVKFINKKKVGKLDKKKQRRSLEGCLSIPKIWAPIQRAEEIVLEYTDINGKNLTAKFSGFHSVIIQHEIDHLNGIIFTQRAIEQKKQLYEETEDKLEKITA